VPASEKRLCERTAGLREQHVPTEPRQELEKLLAVPLLVEQVGAEHELPRRLPQEWLRVVPAHALRAERDTVARGVGAQERDSVLGPVGRKHFGAAERRRERRKPEPRPELEHAQPAHLEAGDRFGERKAARPELRPVRKELVLVEGGFVDQLVGARRAQERELPAGDRERLFDQSAAYRSTGTPSGSRSCA
jgi:hypothetical protein